MPTLPTPITPHDTNTFTPANAGVRIHVTTPGNIKFGFSNAVTMTVNYPVEGSYDVYDSINQIFVTGSTAVFTAYAMNMT